MTWSASRESVAPPSPWAWRGWSSPSTRPAFVYFTDRPDYDHIGLQMARYSAPLAVLAFIAWSPRALVGPARRLGRRLAVAGVVGVPMVAVGASVVTWLWTGANTELG